MTLASKNHVKIGAIEYTLDETIDSGSAVGNLYRPHYAYHAEPLFQARLDVAGAPGKQQLRPERLTWDFDDWSGGENNRIYFTDDPTSYDFSFGLNGRIAGQLTGRPNRNYISGELGTNDISSPVFLTSANGKLWYAGGYNVGFSDDGASWTTVDSTSGGTTDLTGLQHIHPNFRITSVAGHGDYLFYSAYYDDGAGNGVRCLLGKKSDNTNKSVTVQASASSPTIAPFAGMTMMNGSLYAWTGRILRKYDVWDLPAHPVELPAEDIHLIATNIETEIPIGVDLRSTWWADITVAENSVFCFLSYNGRSTLYEYVDGGGFTAVWPAPIGFMIKCIKYENGVLYIGGHWGTETNLTGRGALYQIPLDTRKLNHLGFFRKQNGLNLKIDSMSTSYGHQLMVADKGTGRIFIYDSDLDSISMLDDLVDDIDVGEGGQGDPVSFRPASTDAFSMEGGTNIAPAIGDMLTYGSKRFVSVWNPAGSGAGFYDLLSYDDDEPTNRQVGTATSQVYTYLESGSWDFGLPYDLKVLQGFTVTYKPLTVGQTLIVDYSIDGSDWTRAGRIVGGGGFYLDGRSYFTVSDATATKTFTSLKVRTELIGGYILGTGYPPPIMLGCLAEALMISYDESWDLILRLKDPSTRARKPGVSNTGGKARDYLRAAKDAKSILTFLDGYRYELPGKYSTHTVTIESLQDIIIRPGEGSMKITLRAVPQ